MIDRVQFDAPAGPIGRIVERAVLASYLKHLIAFRGEYLKTEAECKGACAPVLPRTLTTPSITARRSGFETPAQRHCD